MLKNLNLSFGGIKAIDNVNMYFSSGSITGIIGPNGAGKTTLFNLISGFIKPDSGSIILKSNGKDIEVISKPPHIIAKLGIGRLFQNIKIFKEMTVLENVMVSFQNQISENILKIFLNLHRLDKIEQELKEKSIEILKIVGLEDKKDIFARLLSFGQQKLLAIARLIAMDSEVFLLDEPSAGIHPAMSEKILSLLKTLADNGKTIVIIEHNLTLMGKYSNIVYLMNQGRVEFFGQPFEILKDNVLRETYIGIK